MNETRSSLENMDTSPQSQQKQLQGSSQWSGKQVLIIGAARQGLALARYLVMQGAEVILNDQHSDAAIETACKQVCESLPSLASTRLSWVLGSHPLSLLKNIVLVCVSGGVPLELPIIVEAKRFGIPISNDSQIFMENVPCSVAGITGSAGKTTTTTLVGLMAQTIIDAVDNSESGCKVWVGGNIGLPLIDQLDSIHTGDLVILELSSFQLELMTISPHISAILNITPNHLDRHGTFESYVTAKQHILDFQIAHDTAVLGYEDAGAWNLAGKVKGNLVSFGMNLPAKKCTGTYLKDEQIYLNIGTENYPLMSIKEIKLKGKHNLQNILAAYAIIYAIGLLSPNADKNIIRAVAKTVSEFTGVSHRLELVGTWNNISWYNDSIATAPERTIAAINSFTDKSLVLLLGGRDKNLPWEKLAELVYKQVDHVILFGEAADKIEQVFRSLQPDKKPLNMIRCTGMHDAVKEAVKTAQPGDIVLLSPGGTSYDEFKDFEERGERFREWIHQLH